MGKKIVFMVSDMEHIQKGVQKIRKATEVICRSENLCDTLDRLASELTGVISMFKIIQKS